MDSSFYEGTGYTKVIIDRVANVLLISFSIYTRSENGLLLYIGSEDTYFTVTMEKGVTVLRSNLLDAPATLNVKSFPVDDWVEVLIISKNTGVMTVRVANKEVAKANAAYTNSKFKEFYVGGAPQDLRERFNITMQPFKGCLKTLKRNNNFAPVAEQVGISKGCPTDSLVTRKAEFSLGSSLSAGLPGFSLADNVAVSLGFKTTENQGLILQNKQQASGINLALENGHVVLSFNNKIWKSNKKYHDNQWHYLTVKRGQEGTELVIDDEDMGQEQSGSTSIPDTSGSVFLGKDKFKGCISNLYTRRPANLYKAEDFSKFQPSGDVFLDVCTADSPAQLMMDRFSKKR